MKKAALLVNLGSPASPEVPAVRTYLREFLMDPRVLDVNWFLRFCIVHLAILPSRPKASAHAYQSVWTAEGSPLIVTSRKLQALLQARVEVPVELAMRYQEPSITSAIRSLVTKGVAEVLLIPLFLAAWGTDLYRDWLVMVCCRPFFRHLIFHWHAVGLGEWLDHQARPFERRLSHALLERALLRPGVELPTATRIQWTSGDIVVARGEDATLSALVNGVVPDAGEAKPVLHAITGRHLPQRLLHRAARRVARNACMSRLPAFNRRSRRTEGSGRTGNPLTGTARALRRCRRLCGSTHGRRLRLGGVRHSDHSHQHSAGSHGTGVKRIAPLGCTVPRCIFVFRGCEGLSRGGVTVRDVSRQTDSVVDYPEEE